jgi:hypothetical protein
MGKEGNHLAAAGPLAAIAPVRDVLLPGDRPLLIHTGYHKTGTTWMQRVLFRHQAGFHALMTHDDVFDLITRPASLAFDPEPARRLIVERAAATPADAVNLISSEILSGNPFYGGRDSRDFAERLHRIAPRARILITIREQIAMAASIYMQYLSRGGCLTKEAFFTETPAPGYFAFDPSHLEFHRLVGYYRTLFGPENVLVLTQESLKRDVRGFADGIASFSGNRTPISDRHLGRKAFGVSYPEYAAPILRRMNHLRAGPVRPDSLIDLGRFGENLYRATGWVARRPTVRALFGSREPIRRFLARLYADRFVESNRALAAFYPELDLGGYQGV